MKITVGCQFEYQVTEPTAAVVQVQPCQPGPHRIITEELTTVPGLSLRDYVDVYGNVCQRLTMAPGPFRLRYDAQVEVPNTPDEVASDAPQVPVEDLPDEALLYTLPSRYCLSDVLAPVAWELFGSTTPGWPRVQAICDWVHNHVKFGYGSSTPLTTSAEVFEEGRGVCRDFAHLAVTFCRAMSIPARYTFGYLPDIGVPPPDDPMDFCAWFEAYLGDRWWTFDARNNQPRVGRAVIGRGRDALDVAMMTTYGAAELRKMVVWADEMTA